MNTSKTKTNKRILKNARTKNEKYDLRLFIAGLTPKATAAIKNLRLVCEERIKGKYHIAVIDLLLHPQLGRKNQILAIPTLMLIQPHSVRQIIGNLSNTEKLTSGLGIN